VHARQSGEVLDPLGCRCRCERRAAIFREERTWMGIAASLRS
jgi:hypothetical protein